MCEEFQFRDNVPAYLRSNSDCRKAAFIEHLTETPRIEGTSC